MSSGVVKTLDPELSFLEITLKHPPHNMLGLEQMGDLANCFEALGQEPVFGPERQPVRSVALRSSLSGAFSMGIDLHGLLERDAVGRREFFVTLGRLQIAVLKAGIPLLAVVNGPAVAGGAVLAALCDTRVFCAEKGAVCFSESKVNLPVPRFVQELVKRCVSSAAFFDMIVLARNFNANKALQVGFAHQLFHGEEECVKLVADFAGKVQRLRGEVLRETLLQRNSSLIAEVEAFVHNSDSFDRFLADEFVGVGLKKAKEALEAATER